MMIGDKITARDNYKDMFKRKSYTIKDIRYVKHHITVEKEYNIGNKWVNAGMFKRFLNIKLQ